MIRSAAACDAANLGELWRAAGLRFHQELTERELASAPRPELILVEEEGAGEITGTVFGTLDGVRGWVRHLATRPDRRGRGIATALLAELERRLRAAGCLKVNLLIEPDNAAAAGFYARLGYRRDQLLFMEKWLTKAPAPWLCCEACERGAADRHGTPLGTAGVCGANAAPRARPLACPRFGLSRRSRSLPRSPTVPTGSTPFPERRHGRPRDRCRAAS